MPAILPKTHNYTIQSANAVGDIVTIIGTVDGQNVTAFLSLADLQAQKLISAAAVKAFVAQYLLAAAPPVVQDLSSTVTLGSFTQ